MEWIYLLIAGILEVIWATGLKYTDGFSKPLPSAIVLFTLVLSFILLAQALRALPIGTGYAVWTGIGAVGTAVTGIFLFGESGNAARLACIALIVTGIVGLKLTAPP